MLLTMSTLHCNNCEACRYISKLSDCPVIQISQYQKEYLTRTALQRIFFIVSGSYLWCLNSTRMKPLLSNILHHLCLQTAWWSSFCCATLYLPYCKNSLHLLLILAEVSILCVIA